MLIVATLLTLTVLTACQPVDPSGVPSQTSSPTPEDSPVVEPTPEGPQAIVTVAGVDVDGANVSASGFVAGVAEDGGTCSFIFTGPTGDVTSDREGVANVADTSCGLVQVPRESFARGHWEVVLEYTSETTKTVSIPVPLEVP